MKDIKVRNYADDTTIFVYGTDLDPILKLLEKDASLLSKWFANNYMKMNGSKSHLLVLGNESVEAIVNISGSLINESDEEKRLRVTLDKKLNFISHVNSLCKKNKSEIACISTYIGIYGKATVRIDNYHFHNVTFQLLLTCVDVSR